jgi:hypothetical protein
MATAVGRGRDVLWRLDPERAWRAELEEQLTSIREQVGVFPAHTTSQTVASYSAPRSTRLPG